MGYSSYFRFDDDNKTKYMYILSIITKEMGKLKTHSPTYCIMDDWENMCNQIVMNFDINGYDTRGTDGMNVYLPSLKKDIYKNSFLYKGGQLWNRLPDVVKDSPNLETFKYHYELQKSVTDAWMLYSYIHVSILQCKGKLLNIITPRIDS